MNKVCVCAVAGVVGVAQAGSFNEVEVNNTLATANDAGAFGAPGGSVIISGDISQGDVDWFSFTLSDISTLSVFAAFASGDADGVMQVVSGVDVIAFSDDDGAGAMPSLQLVNLAAGSYFVGLSGFGDAFSGSVDSNELFDGGQHSENFAYKLVMGFTVVPSPAPLALLGMGGLLAGRRRR